VVARSDRVEVIVALEPALRELRQRERVGAVEEVSVVDLAARPDQAEQGREDRGVTEQQREAASDVDTNSHRGRGGEYTTHTREVLCAAGGPLARHRRPSAPRARSRAALDARSRDHLSEPRLVRRVSATGARGAAGAARPARAR